MNSLENPDVAAAILGFTSNKIKRGTINDPEPTP